DGAGRGIGFLSGVQTDRAETRARGELHEPITIAWTWMRRYFLQTLPGRAIVVGLAIKLALFLVSKVAGALQKFLTVVDTVAGLAVAAGGAYFLFRLGVLTQRRLLWRVRRKLILSYIFVGFVPALLIVAFFLLCGFLLFYNFSSYLVQSRLRAMAEQARSVAQNTVLDIQRAGGRDVAAIVERRQAAAAEQFPDLSIAVVPATRACAGASGASAALQGSPDAGYVAGPWAHLDPPATIPAWIDCRGFAGLLAYTHPDAHLLLRGVAFPDSPRARYAVVVDLLVNGAVTQQLRDETGVEVKNITPAPASDANQARPLAGHPAPDQPR